MERASDADEIEVAAGDDTGGGGSTEEVDREGIASLEFSFAVVRLDRICVINWVRRADKFASSVCNALRRRSISSRAGEFWSFS